MKFDPVPLEQVAGEIPAHSITDPEGHPLLSEGLHMQALSIQLPSMDYARKQTGQAETRISMAP